MKSFTAIAYAVFIIGVMFWVMSYQDVDAAGPSFRDWLSIIAQSIVELTVVQSDTNDKLALIVELLKSDESIYLEDVTPRYDFLRNDDGEMRTCQFFDRQANVILDTSCNLDLMG